VVDTAQQRLLASGTGAAVPGARRRATRVPLGLIVPALLLALWWAESAFDWIAPNLLPPPAAVIAVLYKLARTGDLMFHVEATVGRVASGFVLGAAAATILGALTGYAILARRLLDPLLQGLRNVPSIAWVPLFILWLGIAEASKIALIAVGVFFPVYLNLMSGIAKTDRKLVEVGRAYRLTGWRLVLSVLVPATLPSYIVGLRGGLGLGWMFVAAAELMGASEGVGFLLEDGQMTGRPALVIASLIAFAVVGKATDLVLVLLGRRILRWQDTAEALGGAGA
jgi:sulfonate transport system permease protein